MNHSPSMHIEGEVMFYVFEIDTYMYIYIFIVILFDGVLSSHPGIYMKFSLITIWP